MAPITIVALAITTMARQPSVAGSSDSEANSRVTFEATAKKMLETALSRHAGNRPLKCDEIDRLVGYVCTDGQARGLKAERLIIELKHVWHSVPESASHEKGEVISRLVSMCILEFYEEHPAPTVKG
jgi:hypothetical protein